MLKIIHAVKTEQETIFVPNHCLPWRRGTRKNMNRDATVIFEGLSNEKSYSGGVADNERFSPVLSCRFTSQVVSFHFTLHQIV